MKLSVLIRRRGRCQTGPTISLFPFLAVLICTMGALVPLLFAMARQARLQALQEARAKAAEHQANARTQRELAEWRIGELAGSRRQTEERLSRAKLALGQVESHARRLRQQAGELRASLDGLKKTGDESGRQRDELDAELKQIHTQIGRAEKRLAAARDDAAHRPRSYAVVPYEGPHGTHRPPIYIECRADAIVLQPEGIALVESDFDEPLEAGNALNRALRAARDVFVAENRIKGDGSDEPYPLLLVRPDGIVAYYVARAAIRSWKSDIGYELISKDWRLEFPKADPQVGRAMRDAVADARQQRRQQAMLAATLAPSVGSALRGAPGTGVAASTAVPRNATEGVPYRGATSVGVPGAGVAASMAVPRNATEGVGYRGGSGAMPSPFAGTSAASGGLGLGGIPGGGFGPTGSPGGGGSIGLSGTPAGGGGLGLGGTRAGGGGFGLAGTPAGGGGLALAGTPGGGGGFGLGGMPNGGGLSSSSGLPGSGISAGSPGGLINAGTSGSIAGTPGTSAGYSTPGTILSAPSAGAGNSGMSGFPMAGGNSPSGTSTGAAAQPGAATQPGAAARDPSLGTDGQMAKAVFGETKPASSESRYIYRAAPGGGLIREVDPDATNSFSSSMHRTGFSPGGQSGGVARTGGAGSQGDSGDRQADSANAARQAASQPTGIRAGEWIPEDPSPQPDKKDAKSKRGEKTKSLADSRGEDWGLPNAARGSVGITRVIRVRCSSNRLEIVPDSGQQASKPVRLGARTEDAMDEFVSAVWEHMKLWGIGGRGMYWRPILQVDVTPDAEFRYAELKSLLDKSGLIVERKM